MLALLLMASAVSGLWACHDFCFNANCPVCQLTYHTVGPPLLNAAVSTPTLLHWNTAPEETVFQCRLVSPQTPSRSPPLV